MRKIALSLFMLGLLVSSATETLCQSVSFHGSPIDPTLYQSAWQSQLSQTEIYAINAGAVHDYLESADFTGNLQLSLGLKQWSLMIDPQDLLSSQFQVSVQTPGGRETRNVTLDQTYQGFVEGNPVNPVRLTIGSRGIRGMITYKGLRYFIEPLLKMDPDAPTDHHLVYLERDVKESTGPDACPILGSDVQDQQHGRAGSARSAPACVTNELAIAMDWSYVNRHGGVAEATQQAVDVMNLVEPNFADAFQSDIDFQIVEVFASECSTCDPSEWTNTVDGLALLDNFGDWANSINGFDNEFDLGQMWTDRNFHYNDQYGVVGLAWRPGVCYYNSKFHLLEDYTSNMNSLRVLTAHEIGHNYGSTHDTISGHIMYPSVNGSSSWSQLSKDAVNNRLDYASCLGACSDCPSEVVVQGASSGNYEASQLIMTNGSTSVSASAMFNAPEVTLFPDFSIQQGAVFEIQSSGCP